MTDRPLYDFDPSMRELLIRQGLELWCKGKVIGRSEGAFGSVYRIDKGAVCYPRYLAAKCPKLERFGSPEKASAALESALHEVEKAYSLFSSPWVNRFTDIKILHGWPFLISRWHDGTLADLIGNPLAWTLVDRLASLLLIVRTLRKAKTYSISAHQDLKPENIFFSDLHRQFPDLVGHPGLHYKIILGDFANANAFSEIGKNTGTRPYMAPEQYLIEPLDASAGTALDVFSIAVIAHECLCDGLHPIGVITGDVWPRREGVSRKWGEAHVWRKWSEANKKDLKKLEQKCSSSLFSTLENSLSVNPSDRPSLEEMESSFTRALSEVDATSANSIAAQIEDVEAMYHAETWPYFADRLNILRSFYAGRK